MLNFNIIETNISLNKPDQGKTCKKCVMFILTFCSFKKFKVSVVNIAYNLY